VNMFVEQASARVTGEVQSALVPILGELRLRGEFRGRSFSWKWSGGGHPGLSPTDVEAALRRHLAS